MVRDVPPPHPRSHTHTHTHTHTELAPALSLLRTFPCLLQLINVAELHETHSGDTAAAAAVLIAAITSSVVDP